MPDKRLIGNPKVFAIESQIVGSAYNLERVRLWLGGNPIGAIEDENLWVWSWVVW